MKKIIILITAILSINALAATSIKTNNKILITNSVIEKSEHQFKSAMIDDLLKKPAMNSFNLLEVAGPSCVKACENAFLACLNQGYPWNSCNWEFQACADECFAIPVC